MKLGEFKKAVAELEGDDDLEVLIVPLMLSTGGRRVVGFEKGDFVTEPADDQFIPNVPTRYDIQYITNIRAATFQHTIEEFICVCYDPETLFSFDTWDEQLTDDKKQ